MAGIVFYGLAIVALAVILAAFIVTPLIAAVERVWSYALRRRLRRSL